MTPPPGFPAGHASASFRPDFAGSGEMSGLHIWLFLIALALFFLHEMDAVRCREWRIFPVLERLTEPGAMLWFYWLHVPLFAGLAYFAAGSVATGGNAFSAGFSAFCILHGILHWAYERHPRNEFRNPLSRSIIWGCALAGLLSLAAACYVA